MALKFYCALVLTVSTLVPAYAFYSVEIPATDGIIKAFATKQIKNHLSKYEYIRFNSVEIVEVGYGNQHAVYGDITLINIGNQQNAKYPVTDFAKYDYVVSLKAYCAYMSPDCFEIIKINLSGNSRIHPLM